MGSEDQAFTIHSNKIRRDYHHPKGNHSHQKDSPRRSNIDLSKYKCFTCDERGDFSRYCPRNKSDSHKKKDKIRHHAHTAEGDDPPRKIVKQEIEDSSSDEEYVMISALMETVTHGSKGWIIDSGASKDIIGFKESFEKLSEHNSPHKVKLGDC